MAESNLRKSESKQKRPEARPRRELRLDPWDPKAEAGLVAGLRSGDAKAFEQMVRSYGPRLLAVARRIVPSEEDARDCLQETFLAAHCSIEAFEDRSRLGAWLHRIVTNAALMKLRARRARPEEPIDSFQATYDRYSFREGPRRTNALTPEELLQRSDTSKAVRQALERLPESYRTVLLLRDIEGYDTRETAVFLETSEGAVKVRLHRARTALKELLGPLFDEELR